MIVRFALAMIVSLSAMPLSAQPAPSGTASSTAVPAPELVRIALQTSMGTITLDLDKTHAPITTANFLRYVDGKRLDGVGFYRAMKLGEDFGLIQGGPQNDPRRIFPPIVHEPTTRTGIIHSDGTISMARYNPGSANADFFITIGALPSLDANPAQAGDNAGFAAFGHVVDGMDVVRKILEAPTSPTEGEGVMKGQMLAPRIMIVTARRVRTTP
jgi:peptidyl-prolyl cis-trans isomerase A (cyclophilin A)